MKNPTMDNLKSMVSNQQQNESQSETASGTDRQAADWVWQKMAEIYGNQWTREQGEEPPSLWIAALSRLRMDQVKAGVGKVVSECIAWPPNLAQFVGLCQNIDTREAFDRFIRHDDPLCQVERKTRQECGSACRTQLTEPDARELFRKTYIKWLSAQDSGKFSNDSTKALPRNLATKPIDHMVQERIRSNKPKTKLEKRMDALRNK